MRIRTVKPSFFKSEKLADLGMAAMLLFEGLWCMADCEGRLEDRPRFIKAEIMPYFDVDCSAILQQLHDAGFIHRYEVAGAQYIWVVKFREHQRITGKEAESTSKFPEPPTGKQSGNNGETTETTGKEGNKEGKGSPNGDSARGAADGDGKKAKSPPGKLSDALPAEFQTAELNAAWAEFEQHRKDKGTGPYTEIGCRNLATILLDLGYCPPEVPALIRECMAANWQGIPVDQIRKFKEQRARAPTRKASSSNTLETYNALLEGSEIWKAQQQAA